MNMHLQQNPAMNDADQGKVMAQIQALLKELSKCAPHPDRPEHQGPLFLHQSADLEMADDHDATLGSIAMESILGTAFASAAGEFAAEAFDNAWNGMEYASHAYQDRQKPSFSLGQRRMIANDFNGLSSPAYQGMMDAFLADLPQRMSLEKHLSHEMRKLYALRKNAIQYGMAA